MSPMSGYSAVLLAGGESRRMGSNKATLLLEGKPFVQFLTEKLLALGVEDILLSGYAPPLPHTRPAPDLCPGRGPLSGIHGGLCRARHRHVLVLTVDAPLVPVPFLRQLLAAHRQGITVACCGRVQPLTGVYDRELAEDCLSLLRAGRYRVMDLLRRAGYSTVEFSGDELLLRGCNTPEEYQILLGMHSAGLSDGP